MIVDKKKFSSIQGQLLKLLSALLAIFLWFYVVNSEPILTERIYNIQVLPTKSLDVTSISKSEISVKLKGARAFLKDFHGDDHLRLLIDLKKMKLNSKQKRIKYTIKDNDLVLPFGVEVVDISPKQITINLDKLIYKNVPIKVNHMNNLSSELKLISSRLDRTKIKIEGARNVMRKVGQVKTRLIDLSELTGQGEIAVSLEDLPNHLRYGDEGDTVKFVYDIRPRKANLTLKNIPILFVGQSTKFRSKVKKVSLDVLTTGRDDIRTSEIKVYADLPSKLKKVNRIKLRAKLPSGVHLLKIHPDYITVRK